MGLPAGLQLQSEAVNVDLCPPTHLSHGGRRMYVGAACNPQPRVTGIANRLRRRPCFRGRIDAVDFRQSVNVVSEWELTPS